MPVISALALLGLIIGLGLERKKLIAPKLARGLSHALVQVVYPCLIFSSLLLKFGSTEVFQLWILPAIVFVTLGVGLIFGLLSVKGADLAQETTRRSYVFLAIMPNYSFVPLVIAQTFFGDLALGYIAIASVGADLFLWTFAFPQIAGRFAWRRIASPALISVVLALLVQFLVPVRGGYWMPVLEALNAVGKLTLPLSMFVFGRQLAMAPLRIPPSEHKAQVRLHIWRLLACPLFVFLALRYLPLPVPALAKSMLLLALSMPGAIVTVVLSELYGADSRFAAATIFWGHIFGIATVTLWQLLALL